MIKETLDKHGLKTFNDTVNARLKNRVKYKGTFTLVEEQEDWDKLAPTHIGDTYMLKGDAKVKIGDTTYVAGEWIIVTNETRLNSDEEVVDEAGEETSVKVEKLGSASLPTADDDGDGLAFVDGDWAIQKNYGYYKPEITTYVVDGSVPPAVMPLPIAFPYSHPLIAGNKYKFTVNDVELGEFTAEEKEIFGETQTVLNIDTDGWNRIVYDNGALRLSWDSAHAGEAVKISLTGEFEGDYVKFDRRYIPGILPEDAMPGDAMIYDGNDWKRQDNYGFSVNNGHGQTFKTHAMFKQSGLAKTSADVKLGELLNGAEYTITVGDDSFTGTAALNGEYVVIEFPDDPTKLRKVTDMGDIVVFDAGMDYLNETCDITVTGFMGERVYKIDEKYLPESKIPDGEENGDANVWVDDEWKIQKEYGYMGEVTEGRTTDDDTWVTWDPDGLPPYLYLLNTDHVEAGKEYSVFVNGKFVGHGVAHTTYGDPRVTLNEPFLYYQNKEGSTGVSFEEEAMDLGLVIDGEANTVDIVEGNVEELQEYVEFNRGYIPAPIRTYEKLEVIPENDVFKDGDIVYLTKQPMARSIVRYKLSDAAAADGFEITDEGIYRDNYDDEPEFWRVGKRYRNGLSWEQIAANETLEGFYPLITIDATNGTIWGVSLKSVSGEESVKFMHSDTEVTADMFVERATMKYDKESDEFVFVSTDAKFDSNIMSVVADNLEFYLPDNMYDFLD